MNGENSINEQVQDAVETAKYKNPKDGEQRKNAKRKSPKSFPFKVDENGIHRRIEYEKSDGSTGTKWVRFGSIIRVVSETRNGDGEKWGRCIEVTDRDGTIHQFIMPLALTAGSGEGYRAELFDLGFELLPIKKAREWLLEYILTAEPEQRARCVSRIGWHVDTFVFPDQSFGPKADAEPVILQGMGGQDHPFNVSGTLKEWQSEVAGPAVGNSRIVFSMCVGLASPLLAITGDESGGFHFRGLSSIGKSTILVIAGSLYGGGGLRGYMRQWRTTDNALESTASLFCNTLLCLDELGQLESKTAGPAIYMLGSGKGKARSSREGQSRSIPEWRLLFLSTGELPMEDKMREAGVAITAGVRVRAIDLRVDAGAGFGVFDNIHDTKDSETFQAQFKASANKFFGTAGRAWVEIIANDAANIKDEIEDLRRMFKKNQTPEGADPQVLRMMNRFALVAAAGESATKRGITGWAEGEATIATLRCFNDWLQERGGVGSSEVAEGRARISEAIEAHGASRFSSWTYDPRRVIVTNRYGYIKRENEGMDNEKVTYFFLCSAFKEILKGLDTKSVYAGLMDECGIVSQKGEPNKIFTVPSEAGSKRLYEIDLDALNRLEGSSGV